MNFQICAKSSPVELSKTEIIKNEMKFIPVFDRTETENYISDMTMQLAHLARKSGLNAIAEQLYNVSAASSQIGFEPAIPLEERNLARADEALSGKASSPATPCSYVLKPSDGRTQ